VADGTVCKTYCGTPLYLAPEVRRNVSRKPYTSAVDVWSLCVILLFMLSGNHPFVESIEHRWRFVFCLEWFFKIGQDHFDTLSKLDINAVFLSFSTTMFPCVEVQNHRFPQSWFSPHKPYLMNFSKKGFSPKLTESNCDLWNLYNLWIVSIP
jgi:serine/threonine-protein kinase Chk2